MCPGIIESSNAFNRIVCFTTKFFDSWRVFDGVDLSWLVNIYMTQYFNLHVCLFKRLSITLCRFFTFVVPGASVLRPHEARRSRVSSIQTNFSVPSPTQCWFFFLLQHYSIQLVFCDWTTLSKFCLSHLFYNATYNLDFLAKIKQWKKWGLET